MKRFFFFLFLIFFSLFLFSSPCSRKSGEVFNIYLFQTVAKNIKTIEPYKSNFATLTPNPATDHIKIKNTSVVLIKEISILSMIGETHISHVFSNKENLHTYFIDISRLSKGKYFVKVIYINGYIEILNLIKL